jgi:hypothetical protein
VSYRQDPRIWSLRCMPSPPIPSRTSSRWLHRCAHERSSYDEDQRRLCLLLGRAIRQTANHVEAGGDTGSNSLLGGRRDRCQGWTLWLGFVDYTVLSRVDSDAAPSCPRYPARDLHCPAAHVDRVSAKRARMRATANPPPQHPALLDSVKAKTECPGPVSASSK